MAVSEGSEAGLKRCSRCRCSLSKITVALSCLECLKCRPEDVAVMCGSRCFAMHFKLEHNPARRNRNPVQASGRLVAQSVQTGHPLAKRSSPSRPFVQPGRMCSSSLADHQYLAPAQAVKA